MLNDDIASITVVGSSNLLVRRAVQGGRWGLATGNTLAAAC